MKILICAHDQPDYINGPNIWLQRILPEFKRHGLEVCVLFFVIGNPDRCDTVQFLMRRGIDCKIYRGKNFTEFRIGWIIEQVSQYSPDIFIPNLDIPAYYASKCIYEAGIPTIGVIHSNDSFYSAIIKEFIVGSGSTYLAAVVTVSEFLMEICKSSGNNKITITQISYGVPIPEKKAVYRENELKLVYVGRFSEKQKRISDVTRVLCKLAKKVPGTKSTLYGSGSTEGMRNIIAEYDAEKFVKIGGLLDNIQLQNRLAEYQVFVLLSDYEGLPIALMEGMAAGLVPVCYKMKSGIPQLVVDGITGFIVDDRGEQFIDAIEKLKNNPDLWREMSDKARKKISLKYSIQNTALKWIELFRELKFNNEKKSNEIPGKINLPDKHPDISKYEDRRWPGYTRFYGSRIKGMIGNAIRG